MNRAAPIIAILALLAIAGFTLFFINRGKLSESQERVQGEFESLQAEQQRLSQVESELMQQKEESDRLTREALEAQAMAEALAEKERQEREKLVQELNDRLAREAEERSAAEAAQQELESKLVELEAAQTEARNALAELERSRQEDEAVPEEEVDLRTRLSQQEEQLVMLETENKRLLERTQILEQQQASTEEEIIRAGGRIELPYPEIRSPNIRRREAIYFKERLIGTGNPGG